MRSFIGFLYWLLIQMSLETIKALFGLAPVRNKPVFSHTQCIKVQRADALPPLPFGYDEACGLQNAQMLGERWQGHVEGLRELRDWCRTSAKGLHNSTPRWIGERAKGRSDERVFVRHEPKLGVRLT